MMRFRMLRGLSSALGIVAGTTLLGANATAQTVFGDVVAQGSLCVGLDCPANPNFGFDTIILRENNLRIFFDDTSVSPFPNNKWRLTVNSSASGGASFFALDDVTGGKQPFRIDAGARGNSVFVNSSGNVGFGTATPGLVTHARNGNTPGQRLEQDTSGGWPAQTWDVAGNEINFFVRDVTNGSKLPFRIRPNAPTSSIDIATSGNVGIGTPSPAANLDVVSTAAQSFTRVRGNTGGVLEMSDSNAGADKKNYQIRSQADIFKLTLINDARNAFILDNILVANSTGNIGIGTSSPAARFHTIGSVRFAGVANCGSGIQSNANGDLSCLASSRIFKNVAGDLAPNIALANIMALRPQTGAYKETPDVPEHWLIAEEVATVDPALVGLSGGNPYVVKTQNVVADLIAVVQQQQRQIEELKRLVAGK